MADKKVQRTNTREVPTNIADAYVNYAVQQQLKAADVPPRKKLDINFSDASKIGNKKSKSNQSAYEKSSDQLYEGKSRNSISWRRYVVYMILITMLSCCFTYSKYMSEAGGKATITTATFAYEITGDIESVSIKSKDPLPSVTFTDETSKTYYFKITNNSDVTVSVYPSASFDTKNGGKYVVTFANGTTAVSESAPLTLEKGTSEATIAMTINPTDVEDKTDEEMHLAFRVEQKS